jgi:hypothetical protein
MAEVVDAVVARAVERWGSGVHDRHDVVWRHHDGDLAPFSRGEGPGEPAGTVRSIATGSVAPAAVRGTADSIRGVARAESADIAVVPRDRPKVSMAVSPMRVIGETREPRCAQRRKPVDDHGVLFLNRSSVLAAARLDGPHETGFLIAP